MKVRRFPGQEEKVERKSFGSEGNERVRGREEDEVGKYSRTPWGVPDEGVKSDHSKWVTGHIAPNLLQSHFHQAYFFKFNSFQIFNTQLKRWWAEGDSFSFLLTVILDSLNNSENWKCILLYFLELPTLLFSLFRHPLIIIITWKEMRESWREYSKNNSELRIQKW